MRALPAFLFSLSLATASWPYGQRRIFPPFSGSRSATLPGVRKTSTIRIEPNLDASDVQELILDLIGSPPIEDAKQPCGQIAWRASNRDDDARVRHLGFEAGFRQLLEVP